MTAPERIWAWLFMLGERNEYMQGGWDDKEDGKAWGYIRADLHDAEIARLTAERDAALVGRVKAQCCMCGKRDLSTDEDGGPECELADGRWVCSRECYERAVDPQPITVQDAARVLAEAINNDMMTFNKALGTLTARNDMPAQHFFAEAIIAYAAALRAIAEQEGR